MHLFTLRELCNAVVGKKNLRAPRAVPGNADNATLKTLDRKALADRLAEQWILDGSAHA
jgi:hypothetical protein